MQANPGIKQNAISKITNAERTGRVAHVVEQNPSTTESKQTKRKETLENTSQYSKQATTILKEAKLFYQSPSPISSWFIVIFINIKILTCISNV